MENGKAQLLNELDELNKLRPWTVKFSSGKRILRVMERISEQTKKVYSAAIEVSKVFASEVKNLLDVAKKLDADALSLFENCKTESGEPKTRGELLPIVSPFLDRVKSDTASMKVSLRNLKDK